ncbi:hypothetical protein ACC734_38680, partial [Rhizobium ruizarguesonis]
HLHRSVAQLAAFKREAGTARQLVQSERERLGITHPDGERTFFTTKGQLPRFSLADVFAVIEGERLQGGYALLCGSFLTDDLTAD